tara:strand:- start:130 stop:537 length:408 start_codon:yes stop_codon:yes gene_type:complete
MNQNDNSSTGAFVVSLTFAVVVFTALYIQHKPTVQSELTEAIPLEIEEVVVEESNAIEWVEEEVITPEPPKVISFAKAFAIARKALGASQTFTWDGKQYSTNTAEENVQNVEEPERTQDLAEGQDSPTLSHTLTP